VPYIVVLGSGQPTETHRCHTGLVGPIHSTKDAQNILDIYLQTRPDLTPRIEPCEPLSDTWILLLGSQNTDNPHRPLQAVSLHHNEQDALRQHANLCDIQAIAQYDALPEQAAATKRNQHGCWCLITKLTPPTKEKP
jgi:hypothetical protein